YRRWSAELHAPLRADNEPPDLGAGWRRGEPPRQPIAARETRSPPELGLAGRQPYERDTVASDVETFAQHRFSRNERHGHREGRRFRSDSLNARRNRPVEIEPEISHDAHERRESLTGCRIRGRRDRSGARLAREIQGTGHQPSSVH